MLFTVLPKLPEIRVSSNDVANINTLKQLIFPSKATNKHRHHFCTPLLSFYLTDTVLILSYNLIISPHKNPGKWDKPQYKITKMGRCLKQCELL